jgi:hypothetical protein
MFTFTQDGLFLPLAGTDKTSLPQYHKQIVRWGFLKNPTRRPKETLQRHGTDVVENGGGGHSRSVVPLQTNTFAEWFFASFTRVIGTLTDA